MHRFISSFPRKTTLIAIAVTSLCATLATSGFAQTVASAEVSANIEASTTDVNTTTIDSEDVSTVEISSKKTRSNVTMSGVEIQKTLPGVNPLKALETLPSVSFQTADPWGNNEQNLTLFVHGFNGQQLGYTLDGVPLGDQQ